MLLGPPGAGSMYAQLRTNLPREVMGFQSFPFDTAWRGSKDSRQFCEHAEVRLLPADVELIAGTERLSAVHWASRAHSLPG